MNSNRFIAELETETIPHLILYTEARKSYMRI